MLITLLSYRRGKIVAAVMFADLYFFLGLSVDKLPGFFILDNYLLGEIVVDYMWKIKQGENMENMEF